MLSHQEIARKFHIIRKWYSVTWQIVKHVFEASSPATPLLKNRGFTSHHCSPALEERSTRGCWGVIDMLCTEEVMGPSGSCCTIQSDCLVGQRTPGKISADEDSDLGKSCYCMCL